MGLNVFPVKVHLPAPDGQPRSVVGSCRLIFDGQTVTVWRWQGGGPVKLVEAAVPLVEVTAGKAWRIDALSGVFDAEKQGGCGCGQPLARWTPRPNVVTAG